MVAVASLPLANSHCVNTTLPALQAEELTPDLDLLKTLRSGVATTILSAVQSDDVVGVVVPFSTSPQTGGVKGGSASKVPLDGTGGNTEGGEGSDSDGRDEHFVFEYG